jgi:predicted transcriptional regulator
MKRSNELLHLAVDPVLVSVHPEFVEEILTGRKRVEFRRRWPKQASGVALIYATAPAKSLAALVEVVEVARQSKTQLWELAKELGGGVTRQVLFDYLDGMSKGVALKLGRRISFGKGMPPSDVFGASFCPPQSFRYLKPSEIANL